MDLEVIEVIYMVLGFVAICAGAWYELRKSSSDRGDINDLMVAVAVMGRDISDHDDRLSRLESASSDGPDVDE